MLFLVGYGLVFGAIAAFSLWFFRFRVDGKVADVLIASAQDDFCYKVDESAEKHGGQLVAQVLKDHG